MNEIFFLSMVLNYFLFFHTQQHMAADIDMDKIKNRPDDFLLSSI